MNKKIMIVCISLICIISTCACSHTSTYTRSNKPGAVLISTYDEAVKKKNANDQFIILFTLVDCPHCHNFHQMLKTYLTNHEVFLYEVILDMEFAYDEIDSKVNKDFPDLKYAPTIYHVNQNEVVSEFKYQENDNLESLFDKWVQSNKLDEITTNN